MLIEGTALDSTDSTPGGASEAHEPGDPSPLPGAPEASPDTAGGIEAGTTAAGEPAPDARAHDAAPRRRRRRRRRKSVETPASAEPAAGTAAPPEANTP